MAKRGVETGDGKIGCIIWLLIVLVVALVGWKAIPVKIASSELYDFMVEQAKWAVNMSNDDLKKAIFNESKRLDLPVAIERITVSKEAGRVKMRAQFTVPLDFPGYVYNWDFDLQVERPIFIF